MLASARCTAAPSASVRSTMYGGQRDDLMAALPGLVQGAAALSGLVGVMARLVDS